MIRTGIFGGSFNPIHNGHLRLAEYFFEKAKLDELWFVVSPQNPFKVNAELLDDNLRLKLVKTALNSQLHFARLRKPTLNYKVSDIEFSLPKPSYMINTLEKIKADYPDRQPILLIGGDNWERFPHWYQHEKIEKEYEIFVYSRGDVQFADAPLINISSTDIRERIKKGQSISGLVPKSIEALCLEYYS